MNLSYAERRMWFLNELHPGATDYLLPYVFRVDGPLDAAALRSAAGELHRRHEVLRSTYRTEDGEPRRVVHAAAGDGPSFTVTDLRDLAPAERAGRLGDLLAADQRTPFDLARQFPVRWLLIRLSDTEHVLAVTAHHIAFDGWSGWVLCEELGTLYDAAAAGTTAALAPVRFGYADHVAREHDRMSRGDLAAAIAFGERTLAGVAPLDLPLDRSRPPVWHPDGDSVALHVPPALAGALTALGRTAGATRFMTVLAVFTGLLARLTGQTDIAVGTAVSGRDSEDTHETIGLFTNTVVLRAEVTAEATFRDVLDRAVTTTLAAMDHQTVPFDVLVERLQPDRDLSRNPLFQAMFVFEELGGATVATTGPRFTPVEVTPGTAMVDLTLTMRRDADGGFSGHLDYATALFDRSTVERIGRLFLRLAERAVAEPGRSLATYPLSSADEQAADLPYRPAPLPAPVPELIAAQARLRPDAVAVAGPDGTVDYRTLTAAAGDLAADLARAGVRRGDVVAICADRGPHLVTALLGTLTSGAAALWLNPAHPTERLRAVLADAGARLAVTAGTGHDTVRDCGVPLLAADTARPSAAGSGWRPPRIAASDVAYIAYTSGSTGTPKGVQITHGSLSEHLPVIAAEFGITAGSRIALTAALGFDVSLEQILTALVGGARVVPLDPGTMSADEVLDGVARHGVTHLNLTPLYYRELIGRAAPRDPRLAPVEVVYLAGDVIRGSDLQWWRDGGFDGRFVCCYGPTEATVTCTAIDTAGCTGRESVMPIGRPVPGTRAYVLDGALQPVPAGMPGELYLGGRRVARGYLGRPAATAGAFLPDPFSDEPGARMYRTGDVVRARPDGVLEFQGRADRQIKIRGHRVEPAEVETALLACPRVRAAAVVHRPVGATGEKGLVAYVAGPGPDEVAALAGRLRSELPSYLVPAAIVALDELPRTPSGKLDHTALPAPELGRPDPDIAAVAPRTPAETALLDAMRAVLGIDGFGVHHDFFRLGGSSLTATRLVARLRDHAGLVVSLRDVFTTPTAAALAERVRQAPAAAAAPPARADRTGPLPLSAAQRRLWFLHRLDRTGREYLVPATYRLRGPLDVGALRAACRRLAERHEILRTRYVIGPDGEPAQVIDPPGDVPVEVGGTAGPRGFDLSRDHQFRVSVVPVGPQEHILLLLTHHIAVDGWSWKIIGNELAALYQGSELPAPAWQYADHAVAETARDLGAHVAYWRDALTGGGTLNLPIDRPRPEVRDATGAVRSVRIPAEHARAILDHGRTAGATVFATWFAVYSALLSRVSGQPDLVIGVPVDCRDGDEAATVLGCFVNTMAVRVPEIAATFTGHLAAARSLLAAAYPHREAPFEQVVAALGRDRDPSRTPLFDTLFQVLDDAGPALPLAGLVTERIDTVPPAAMTDLSLAMRPNPDGSWTGELEYATALFDPATVDRIGERLVRLIAAVATRPDAELAGIDLLTGRERAALGASEPYTDDPRTVPELFAAHVARTPDAIAVTGSAGTMTYRELDERADRLARRLLGAGVKPGSAVAVSAGRSGRTIAALLAVLRCAAVYVPVDGAEPPERRAALLDEIAAVAVVTDETTAARFADAPCPVLVEGLPDDDVSARRTPPGALPADAAYVIFTSGSTGRPKGVVVDHAAFTHHCQVQARAYDLAPGARMALLASLSFDASMDQMAAPLISGAAVVPLDARSVTPAQMLQQFHDHGVTLADVTPVYYRELLRAAVPGDPRLASLRMMDVGGDVVTGEDAAAWRALGVGAEFSVTYGPTEATVAATFQVIDEDEARRAGRAALPIGRPLPGSRLLVLDEALRPVLPGAIGELFIGGRRIARGYLNRPDLTADRFVPDPLGPPGARLYRTGDLVRLRPDGSFEFHGRTDRQVKIRGFRVEPAEIESVLSALPGVSAAVVVPGLGAGGEQRLLAYLVPRTGLDLDVPALRALARTRLPRHLMPAALTVIDALPLTASGKVDRARLPRVDPAAVAEPSPGRALDPTEQQVAEIWAEVLGVPAPGPDDDFFDLGGHSLTAIRVGQRIEEIFAIELPLHRFFTTTTVESLAAAIRDAVEAALDTLTDAEIVALAAQDLESDSR
ncbi:amino acid adenylation domain-containing protein [Actinoplanes utahensis]|uniref:amino acid adenylation domain-containing protein n=1 Tax=Actinoplanes utahensis TaxID=1869 RepID=UPI0031F17BB3